MEELNTVQTGESICKTWTYTEKNDKISTYHTISVTKDRFTHTSEVKESNHAMKQRTDINLKNIHSVNALYGHSRNLKLAIILAVLAIALLAAGIASLQTGPLGIAFLLAAVILVVAAIIVYRKIKPSFMVQINTVGTVSSDTIAHGNSSTTVSFGKKQTSPIFIIIAIIAAYIGASTYNASSIKGETPTMAIICLVVAGISLFCHFRSNSKASKTASSTSGTSYKFEMDPETGNDIVDTLGEFIINN